MEILNAFSLPTLLLALVFYKADNDKTLMPQGQNFMYILMFNINN